MRNSIQTTCCIAGGGPAGMMLGFLLARAGVEVVVLEKHADFLRDFRGDTIHPSTLELMHELGLVEAFLARPHQKVFQLKGLIGNTEIIMADFSHLPVRSPFIALMPQWDFLNFLADQGKRYPQFKLMMQSKAEDLLLENGHVTGIQARTPEGPVSIHAALTVSADGRHSELRGKAGLKVVETGTPIDVLWMRISRKPTDEAVPLGRFARGKIFVMLYRDTYWQCAYVIPKGGFEAIKARGLDALHADIAECAPFLQDRLGELASWDDIKLLTVTIDHLLQWYAPGFLCIGDAAHAMSPVGGVGINLAIQDAVAAANILAGPLRESRLTEAHLRQVQRRREWPTRMTQRLQVLLQNRIFAPIMASTRPITPPWWLRKFTFLRRIPARLVGMGFRVEHIGKSLKNTS